MKINPHGTDFTVTLANRASERGLAWRNVTSCCVIVSLLTEQDELFFQGIKIFLRANGYQRALLSMSMGFHCSHLMKLKKIVSFKRKLTMALDLEELKTKAATYNPGHREGKIARAIEEQTAKLPSDLFLWAAVGSMAASLTLKVLKQDHLSVFIGQWAPSFLLLGLYNKIVKVEGHDKQSKEAMTLG